MNYELNDEVAVPASYAFIHVNSRDRNLSTSQTSPFTATGGDRQPWNDFLVQKPAQVLNAFARRIGVVELNFPWAIPNITAVNNKLYIATAGPTISSFTLPVGFYSGTQIATTLNGLLAIAYPTNTPTFTWDISGNFMTFAANGGSYTLAYSTTLIMPTYEQYYQQPSLLKTMGFSYNQVQLATPTGLIGAATQLLYTQYLDVVSEKLHYNNEVQDGSSQNNKNQTSVLCRIFCADESSNNRMLTGQAPFLIHRQFRNPKMLKWNPQAMIDWFQIKLYDEYGNLVEIPAPISVVGTPAASYPDFQLFLMATEN